MTEDNRIPRIRAVLAKFEATDVAWPLMQEIPAVSDLIGDLGAILDSAPPAPRVWFPGEEIPAGTWVLGAGNWLREPSSEGWTIKATPHVEVFVPSMDEYDAIVRRAREERTTCRASEERANPDTEGTTDGE